jgi:multiple sugar transport system substrate-binding protein
MTRVREGLSRRAIFQRTAALAAGSALALAACQRQPSGAPTEARPAAVPPGKIVATNWIDHTEGMEAFAAEFPQIQVDYAPIDFAGHYKKVQTGAVAGAPVDAFWLHDAYATDYISNGLVRPVDDLVKRDKDVIEDIYPVALKYHTRQEKLYGIPQNLSVFMIYYDKDRFAEEGIAAPAADWTLETMLQAATKITRPGTDRWGIMVQTDPRGYWSFLRAHGGAWTDEQGTRSRLADAETIAGIQYIKDLFDRYKVAVRPEAIPAFWSRFQNRQAGMFFTLNSESAWNLRKTGTTFTWDLAAPPGGPRGRGVAQACTSWVLGEGGKQLEAAWFFTKWMTGEKGQRLLTRRNMIVASRKRVAEDPEVNPPPPASLKATSQAHGFADFYANPSVALPTLDKANRFNAALNTALSDIFSDKAGVRDALAAADALVKSQGIFDK